MGHPVTDPFIVVHGGVVSNAPQLPVFDLDILVDGDVHKIGDLYQQILQLINDRYANHRGEFAIKDLPPTLADVITRTEDLIKSITATDDELMALARFDDELLTELFEHYGTDTYGVATAQTLAARALGLIGIAVSAQNIRLTDVEATPGTGEISTGQLAYAIEQYNLTTGDALDADAIETGLDWAWTGRELGVNTAYANTCQRKKTHHGPYATNPYDSGERAEPRVWLPYSTKVTPATPTENFGKVDFDDDEGHTIAVVYIERKPDGSHRLIVDPLIDPDYLEVVIRPGA